MLTFNNNAYEPLVRDLINDAFYTDNCSIRGKIATVRQYSEVIVRRILGLSITDQVTIGNKKIRDELLRKSGNNALLKSALYRIRDLGNKCTHTQEISEFSQVDLDNVLESLFQLYSYLFIEFFRKYEFGRNDEIVSAFSILPPIIRYIALNFLHENDPRNLMVIDKLVLAIFKAFNKEKAIAWIEERKDELESLSSATNEANQDLIRKIGMDVASVLIEQTPNMYDLCSDRISLVSCTIERNGKLYSDFESALSLYRSKGTVSGTTPEAIEFNSIMEFCYLGRRTKQKEFQYLTENYQIVSIL